MLIYVCFFNNPVVVWLMLNLDTVNRIGTHLQSSIINYYTYIKLIEVILVSKIKICLFM